jgi:isopentenyl diphosphate isomerase/L-lactate dehydrogenase-like FMN-dependent dehydrogenase
MSTAWGNYRGPDGVLDGGLLRRVEVERRPQLTLEEIDQASKACGLPWIAKGVLSTLEAKRVLLAGATSVYISNHGGRALDGVPPTLAVLPEVSSAARELECRDVLFDGGVRRANDVLKAVALGADSVGIGRLVAAALGAGGEYAVSRLFELLHQELENGLALLGRRSIDEVMRDAVSSAVRPSNGG